MTVRPLSSPPLRRTLPVGFTIRLDPRVRRWADGSVLIGGAPWRISRIKPPVQDLVRRLVDAGDAGIALESSIDLAAGRLMLDRGFAQPAPPITATHHAPASIVIPAMDHPESLDELLASLEPRHAVVIDDGSRDPGRVAQVTSARGAQLIEHDVNRGPAAARNTGLASTKSAIVAFIDSDCLVSPDWPDRLLHHFDDPAVAAVAPRVAPTHDRHGILERYETTRSSLDMGRTAELVRPGARLSFIPSASLLIRRSALGSSGFDSALRLGEDVDLVWRLVQAGWLVRYDPTVVVRHRTRSHPREWLTRRYEYGTSAADLEKRHPGGLTPARVSSWNLVAVGLIGGGHPVMAAAVCGAASTMLWGQTRELPRGALLAMRTTGQGLLADSAAIGHLLRREWWPLGLTALALSPRSRPARVAAACMLGSIAYEWVTQRPRLDPFRYATLRLIDDAAYGTGVISSAISRHEPRVLMPHIKFPRLGRARPTGNRSR